MIRKNATLRRTDRPLFGALLVAALAALPAVIIPPYTEGSASESQTSSDIAQIQLAPASLAVNGMAEEQKCLAEAMYFEARGEGNEGERAIAEVVMQRTRDKNFPKTICGVVYQGSGQPHPVCQFSFACDGSLRKPKIASAWDHANELASEIVNGDIKLGSETGRATHFHSIDVTPAWASVLEKTTQIGNHIFYRWASHPKALAVNQTPATVTLSSGRVVAVGGPASSDEVQPHI